jgi:hypothetical protein
MTLPQITGSASFARQSRLAVWSWADPPSGTLVIRDNRDVEEVVELAMTDLTSFVYRRRRIYNLRIEKREKSIKDRGARAAAIHTFKHLKHGGYHFDADAIQSWALAHRWKASDAAELGEYAAGVLAGTRYHTDPDPLGPLQTRDWYASVVG